MGEILDVRNDNRIGTEVKRLLDWPTIWTQNLCKDFHVYGLKEGDKTLKVGKVERAVLYVQNDGPITDSACYFGSRNTGV